MYKGKEYRINNRAKIRTIMNLKIKHFVIFITTLILCSCREEPKSLVRIEGKILPVADSLHQMDSINQFVSPYRNRINQVLDSSLAFAPKIITKEDGRYNSSAGNLLADLVLEMASPVFAAKTGKEIDFVLLNYGGIRSVISPGKVTARTAFEVMPFENNIVVAELDGTTVRELVSFLVNATVPHPISGLEIVVGKNNRLDSVTIQGKPFDESDIYYVATSDYMVTGGDRMDFFKENRGITDTDYLIRNAMIDFFKKIDTIAPVVDNRFIKLN